MGNTAVIPPPPDGSGIVAQGAIPPPPDGSSIIAQAMQGNTRSSNSLGGGGTAHSFSLHDLGESLRNTPNLGSSEGSGLMESLADYDKASGGEVMGGIHDIIHGDVAKGFHRIIGGVGAGSMPVAALTLPAAVTGAPVTTGASIAAGVGGQKLAKSAAEGLGASPDQASLAGDVGGIVGGIGGAKLTDALGSVARRALLLGKTPQEAYQSALKPSTLTPPSKVESMVQTGLNQEIPVSKAGVEKLSSLLEDLQDQVTQTIGSGQGKTISKGAVLQRLNPVVSKFSNQVTPQSDLNAISDVGREFADSHPSDIPAADAQAMKVGTYQQLGDKAYGELSTATKESQKALARGLKEELANTFPELGNLNAAESKLYDLQPALQKAVQRQANHQLGGIGTPIVAGAAKALTGSNKVAAVAALVKGVIDDPIVKSRLAIALNRSGVPLSAANSRIQAYSGALAGVASSANDSTDENRANQ